MEEKTNEKVVAEIDNILSIAFGAILITVFLIGFLVATVIFG